MNLLLWAPLALPVLLALAGLPRPGALSRLAPILASLTVLATGVAFATSGEIAVAASGVLRADALSAWMLVVIGGVGLIAIWGGWGADAHYPPTRFGSYGSLLCLFLAAMSLAVVSDNMGLMWAALEATTITTAFLVGRPRTRQSLEASWKYVILGSAGIAIALLGIVLVYAASRESGEPTLSWLSLSQPGAALDPALLQAGSALAVLGFATKAGLAPMHSWLPDAHSQAPAPVSGLMSGVLLSVALYAILRTQAVAEPVLGPELLRTMLVVGGLLSLLFAAALLLRQRDYKRMLAYSSIEHMGMMALGAAIGPTAVPAVLLYMLSHGLLKAAAFVLAGRVFAVEHSSAIAEVRALLARRPALAWLFLLATAGLLGFPPFGIFFAELDIVLAGWTMGLGPVVLVAVALLLAVFAALVRHTAGITLGAPQEGSPPPDPSSHGPRLPILFAFAGAAVLPFLGQLGPLLDAAAAVLAGHAP